MRRVRHFPIVVVGLIAIAGQTQLLSDCRAWDSIPAAALSDPAYSQPMNVVHYDPSVQQAGYYNSRPRQNMSAAGVQQNQSSRSGALFRGQKVKMPSLPFGRQSPPNQQVARVPQSSGPAAGMNNAINAQTRMAQPQQQRRLVGQSMPQRMPVGTPIASRENVPTGRAPNSRPPQPIEQPPMAQPVARHTPAVSNPPTTPNPSSPNSSPVSPWNPTQPAARSGAAGAPKTAAMASPADRLVAEAHALSTRAESENDYTHIIETCRRAQASQPSSATMQFANNLTAWSLNRRGQVKAEAGDDKQAILDFDEAVRTDATCWRAIHNRGVLLAQAGQFERAFDDFTHTIELNSNFAKAYSNRAALFMVANNLDSAVSDYKRAIRLDPNLAVAHRGCGRVCQLRGRIEDAIAHYDAAVQLAPNDAYAAACRADLLTDIGRYAEAASEYERAIELDPASTQAKEGSAWLLATCPDSEVRNPDLAIERARAVIELVGDKEAVNYDTLAAAQASAGDFDSAIESMQHAIELSPADERGPYQDRLVLYQQAKPFRISPIERFAQQVSYETTGNGAAAAR